MYKKASREAGFFTCACQLTVEQIVCRSYRQHLFRGYVRHRTYQIRWAQYNKNFQQKITRKIPGANTAAESTMTELPIPNIAKRGGTPETPHDPKKNHLLAALPEVEYQRWLPHLEWVGMPLGRVLYEAGGTLAHVYFPHCRSARDYDVLRFAIDTCCHLFLPIATALDSAARAIAISSILYLFRFPDALSFLS